MSEYHLPALATESIEGLNIKPSGIYVDATFGGGGHAQMILDKLNDNGHLYAFDQDEDALRNVMEDERLTFAQSNFKHFRKFLRLDGIKQVDGIFADLGVSSHQFNEASRGFSYRYEADLDMRMNQQEDRTAADVLMHYSAEDLQAVFSEYGEVRNSRTLAQTIVKERDQKAIRTIGDFLLLIEPLIRGSRNRYLSQVFQALRIEVNDEMRVLKDFLEDSLHALKPNGRLVVISYHSLEDRMVKNFLKTGDVAGKLRHDEFGHLYRPFKLITKKAIAPGASEISSNSRSRSAKLRVGERLEDDERWKEDGL